ncbi:MAG: 6-bladed beta-propeller [Steroidobacteraceae bacterium]|nr:6-bladed beta-propeller [Deltaproteobacteria bacterium]
MKKATLYLLMACHLVLASCAVAPPVTERFYWPPPPDRPRIEWIKAYSSQLDIERSSAQRFFAAIMGGDAPISLLKPIEVKSLPDLKRFYVSDVGRAAVLVFDLDKHELRSLATPEGAPPIVHPLSIVSDRDNNLYVLERRSSTILVFDSSERYLRAIRLKTASISSPVALAIDQKKGRLYVSDAATRRIVVLDLLGVVQNSIGSAGQFNLPVALVINSKGQIIVADAFDANIQIFDADGKFLSRFGRRGDSVGDFQLIKSVAVDSSDNIYVVDGRSHSVSVFNEQGELLLVLGGFYAVSGSGKVAPGGFSVPIGIDIDSTDRMYVVDQLNARVQVFQYLSDSYLRNHPAQ